MPKTRTVILIAVPLVALLFFSLYLVSDVERHAKFKEVKLAGQDLKIGLEHIDDARLWLYLYNPNDIEVELDRADILIYKESKMIGEIPLRDNIIIPPKAESFVDADLTLNLGDISGIVGIASAAFDKYVRNTPIELRAEIAAHYDTPLGYTYTGFYEEDFLINDEKPTCEEEIDKSLNELSWLVENARLWHKDGFQINDDSLEYIVNEGNIDTNLIDPLVFYEKGCIADPSMGILDSRHATQEQKERSDRLWNEFESYYDP